jgi:signal transduction histidine kinase
MTAAVVILLVAVLGLGRRVVGEAHRMRLIAEAEHELRGPLQAIALAAEADDRSGGARRTDVRAEVERARVALDDLAAARVGRRAGAASEPLRLDRLVWRAATASDLMARRKGGGVHLDWSAGPVTVHANRGRLTQALSNLLANAVEHGGGQVRVSGRRTRRGVRVEVRDSGRADGPAITGETARGSGRGHGLTIAAKAVHDSGGTLTAGRAGSGTAVAIELPVVEARAIELPVVDARAIESPVVDARAIELPVVDVGADGPAAAAATPPQEIADADAATTFGDDSPAAA